MFVAISNIANIVVHAYILIVLINIHSIAAKQCKNLTESDAPAHGGLVCHWFQEASSQQCSIKCNPGYDFTTDRINAYESCGPSSGFKWTFRLVNESAKMLPCICVL